MPVLCEALDMGAAAGPGSGYHTQAWMEGYRDPAGEGDVVGEEAASLNKEGRFEDSDVGATPRACTGDDGIDTAVPRGHEDAACEESIREQRLGQRRSEERR